MSTEEGKCGRSMSEFDSISDSSAYISINSSDDSSDDSDEDIETSDDEFVKYDVNTRYKVRTKYNNQVEITNSKLVEINNHMFLIHVELYANKDIPRGHFASITNIVPALKTILQCDSAQHTVIVDTDGELEISPFFPRDNSLLITGLIVVE